MSSQIPDGTYQLKIRSDQDEWSGRLAEICRLVADRWFRRPGFAKTPSENILEFL